MRNAISGILSTVLSGMSNVTVQLVVAWLVPAAAFGQFALISATIIFFVGAGRAVVAQTDSLRGAPGPDQQPINAAYVVAAALGAAGALLWVVGAALPTTPLLLLGVATAASSAFVLQDCARFRCFRTRRSEVALLSDTIVLILAVVGLFFVQDVSDVSTAAVLVWSLATVLGFIPMAAILRYVPRTPERPRWLSRNLDLVGPSTGEFLMQSGLPYAVSWLVASVGGFEALAGYRLIQLIFAAVSNVGQGLNSVVLPRIVDSGDPRVARRAARGEVLLLTTMSLLVIVALVVVPDQWGESAFGDTWVALSVFLVPGAIHGMVNALSISNYSLLRLLGFARFSLAVRTWSVLASVLLVALGVGVLGAQGAAWALALVAAGAWAIRAAKATREVSRLIAENRSIRSASN